jgi:glycine/D-amino acid oxidase-like deaminating enzyme
MHGKVLIIGGGLSGLLVANALRKRGVMVDVLDDGNNHSSRVAAGLVNPISFRRTLLSWNASLFYPFAKTFYEEIQKNATRAIIKELSLRRIFSSKEEVTTWKQRLFNPEFTPFLLPLDEEDAAFGPYGSGRVTGFCVDGEALLNQLKSTQNLIQKEFVPADIDPEQGVYDGTKYDNIIFCCGYRNHENPFFKHLPVQATKGQLLLVEWNNSDENTSYHRKCFALPKGDKRFKLGATFEWGELNLDTTQEAKEKLLSDFASISSDTLVVKDKVAGIRPTSPDRKPIIGLHPQYPKLGIFNGLGTKGYLTAPYLANHFVDHLLTNAPLDPTLSLNRFER